MISVIQARLRAIEVNELEDRIAELEKVVDHADHGGPRRMRRF